MHAGKKKICTIRHLPSDSSFGRYNGTVNTYTSENELVSLRHQSSRYAQSYNLSIIRTIDRRIEDSSQCLLKPAPTWGAIFESRNVSSIAS
jgi:hypothetical protein